MVRPAMRRVLLGLVALNLSCRGFDLVGPQAGVQPWLSVGLQVTRDERSSYDLNALLSPGTDARGQPNRVPERAFYVDGSPVRASDGATPELLSYRWSATRGARAAQSDSVYLEIPAIGTTPAQAFSVTIPIAPREGSASIDLPVGEDLRLRISPPPAVSPQLPGGVDGWDVEVRRSCSGNDDGTALIVNGRGAYPSELRLPREWFPAALRDSAVACFRATSSYRPVGTPFPVGISVYLRITWRIRLQRSMAARAIPGTIRLMPK